MKEKRARKNAEVHCRLELGERHREDLDATETTKGALRQRKKLTASAPENVPRLLETGEPQPVTDDDDRYGRRVFVGREATTERRRHTKHVEVMAKRPQQSLMNGSITLNTKRRVSSLASTAVGGAKC